MTRNVGPIVCHRHLRPLVKSASNEKPNSRTTFPRGERIGKMGLPLSTAQLFTYVFVCTVLYSCVFTLSLPHYCSSIFPSFHSTHATNYANDFAYQFFDYSSNAFVMTSAPFRPHCTAMPLPTPACTYTSQSVKTPVTLTTSRLGYHKNPEKLRFHFLANRLRSQTRRAVPWVAVVTMQAQRAGNT